MQYTITIYSTQYGCYITAIPLSLGVGGRGLCMGEAENRAGKAALSRTKASGNIVERRWLAGIARTEKSEMRYE